MILVKQRTLRITPEGGSYFDQLILLRRVS